MFYSCHVPILWGQEGTNMYYRDPVLIPGTTRGRFCLTQRKIWRHCVLYQCSISLKIKSKLKLPLTSLSAETATRSPRQYKVPSVIHVRSEQSLSCSLPFPAIRYVLRKRNPSVMSEKQPRNQCFVVDC